ncbi:Putative peptidoglycan binding domain-containing protein [Marinospirillum celere]|uniref:Putative peptidoglycan binding domain-containing protein n=1 Tax=Marinospirillum celere TaxID=1122252 RepID=A0A1I1ITS7_9GAMM|nr:L,D-transpeptidase family protein [Marinospirillum celere]SFC39595.1 Putative peptidoglycan binding domain-containing protein [Marinospirillum celere]
MNKSLTGSFNGPLLFWLFMLLLPATIAWGKQLPSSNPTLEAWVQSTAAHQHADIQLVYPQYLGILYRQARFQNFWLDAQGKPNTAARQLKEDLKPWLTLDDHPRLASYRKLYQLLEHQPESNAPRQRQSHDLIITDYFLRFQQDLLSLFWNQQDHNEDHGVINAYERWDDWPDEVTPSSIEKELINWLAALKKQPPSEWAYTRVIESRPVAHYYDPWRQAFSELQTATDAGPWPQLSQDLKPGSLEPEVTDLAKMLSLLGDLETTEPWNADEPFDDRLGAAVKSFQKRHQLPATGQVDAATRKHLNVSPQERQRRLAHNLRRLYHLPPQLNDRHLMVNLASQRMEFVEDGEIQLSMKTIVGREHQRTPIMSQWLTSLVLNPIWNVPPSIAKERIFPRAQQNPDYLASRDYALVEGWHTPARKVNFEDLPDDAFTGGNSPYRIIQKSGNYNQLGRAKFRLSNQEAIYLHDTPYRQAFSKEQRAISAGCVRVEDSAALVDALLAKSPQFTPETVAAIYSEGEERYLQVRPRVAVYLMYWTAWTDAQGRLHWHEDIYHKDQMKQERRLAQKD